MCRSEDFDTDKFLFRGLHPTVFMGTASDRYGGWIGQIYSSDLYKGRLSSRTKRVGGRSFKEEVLPVESVAEYFRHFRVLEIDYTFYKPLLNENGSTTSNYHVLSSYQAQLSSNDYVLLKVPQGIFAQRLLRGNVYVENQDYLNPELFVRSFYDPAIKILGSNLRGFVFEQEYQRQEHRMPASQLALALNKFFSSVPGDERYHIELRTESYLTQPIFEVLERFGIGQVLSHWTWLPPLMRQFQKAGHRFFNSGRQCIVRLMTPIGTRYENAYALAHPFDKLVPGMLQPSMIRETAGLMWDGIAQNMSVNVIINNRSGGNAPLIAQLIAAEFLETGIDA